MPKLSAIAKARQAKITINSTTLMNGNFPNWTYGSCHVLISISLILYENDSMNIFLTKHDECY